MLLKAGVEVIVANDGRETVQLAQAQSFDLIFMDIQMPHVDGYEATRQIRRAESEQLIIDNGQLTVEEESRIPHVPIVALTANAMKGDEQKCFAAGFDDYLLKPIEREKVIAVLEKHLAPASAAESTDSTNVRMS